MLATIGENNNNKKIILKTRRRRRRTPLTNVIVQHCKVGMNNTGIINDHDHGNHDGGNFQNNNSCDSLFQVFSSICCFDVDAEDISQVS